MDFENLIKKRKIYKDQELQKKEKLMTFFLSILILIGFIIGGYKF